VKKLLHAVEGWPAVYFSLNTGGFAASEARLDSNARVQALKASLSGAACEIAGESAARLKAVERSRRKRMVVFLDLKIPTP
jgi:hypothetical protein